MNMIKSLKVAGAFLVFSMNLTAQDISFNIEVTSPKSTEPMSMKVVSNATKIAIFPNFAGDKSDTRFLIDNTTNQKYVLMINNGQKIAMAVNNFEVEKATEAIKEPKITSTKEVRTIDGYKCTKIIAESDEETSDIWLTQEAGLSYNELYKIFNSTKNTPGARRSLPSLKNVQGFPIEIITKDKAKDRNVTIRIKNISRAKTDPQMFSMDGYKVVDMTKKVSH